MVALRQTLLNPSSCSEFTAFVAVKGDSLESNVHFWLEVQKFKVKMLHVLHNRPAEGQATRRQTRKIKKSQAWKIEIALFRRLTFFCPSVWQILKTLYNLYIHIHTYISFLKLGFFISVKKCWYLRLLKSGNRSWVAQEKCSYGILIISVRTWLPVEVKPERNRLLYLLWCKQKRFTVCNVHLAWWYILNCQKVASGKR